MSIDGLFGKVVYTYTRKHAIEDGKQIDVTKTAKEAGFKFPVFVTRAVWEKYIKPDESLKGWQDIDGRLWDTLWMLFVAIKSGANGSHILYKLYYQIPSKRKDSKPVNKLVTLKAEVGAKDIDDPAPAITIMLPEED